MMRKGQAGTQLAVARTDTGTMMVGPRHVLASAAARGLTVSRRPTRPIVRFLRRISKYLDRLELRLHTAAVRSDRRTAKWAAETRRALEEGTLQLSSADDIRAHIERERSLNAG